MKINKAYKFRIYPTKPQMKQLSVEFGNARFVWNHALAMRKKAYDRRKANMNYVSLNKHITKLKRTKRYDWLKQSTADVLTQKLIDLDTAYTNFFKGRAKFPNFKKKSQAQSIRFALDQRTIQNNYESGVLIKLPKIGEMNIKWSQYPEGTPKMATVSKTPGGKYFVSFACEVEVVEYEKTGKSVGIDIGIKDVVVTSDGFYSEAPKFTYKYQRELKLAQRALSRKTKGSNRYAKQRVLVARIHEKIANSRRDFLHKLTTKIIREYDFIAIEDLNVKGIVKNRCLSKAVSDVGMFELKRQLTYKAGWYGKTIVQISRWFPSTKTCSNCGVKREMRLKDRVFNCECGFSMCRDLNASKNIKMAGEVMLRESYQPVSAKKSA